MEIIHHSFYHLLYLYEDTWIPMFILIDGKEYPIVGCRYEYKKDEQDASNDKLLFFSDPNLFITEQIKALENGWGIKEYDSIDGYKVYKKDEES